MDVFKNEHGEHGEHREHMEELREKMHDFFDNLTEEDKEDLRDFFDKKSLRDGDISADEFIEMQRNHRELSSLKLLLDGLFPEIPDEVKNYIEVSTYTFKDDNFKLKEQ